MVIVLVTFPFRFYSRKTNTSLGWDRGWGRLGRGLDPRGCGDRSTGALSSPCLSLPAGHCSGALWGHTPDEPSCFSLTESPSVRRLSWLPPCCWISIPGTQSILYKQLFIYTPRKFCSGSVLIYGRAALCVQPWKYWIYWLCQTLCAALGSASTSCARAPRLCCHLLGGGGPPGRRIPQVPARERGEKAGNEALSPVQRDNEISAQSTTNLPFITASFIIKPERISNGALSDGQKH